MKILTLDIETCPAKAYVWSTFKENIPLVRVIEPGRILCWAAKWLGQNGTHKGAEWDTGPEFLFDEPDFIVRLWHLLDEADVVVSYNGKTFDIPRINAAFVERGLGPPSPYFHVDLYQTVRHKFKFLSGKLEYVVKRLELDHKADPGGFETWIGCMEGDPKAQSHMLRYNVQDVKVTEQLYVALRPWVSNHPNESLFSGKEHACPTCGSGNLQKRGFAYTKVSVFQQYWCINCGTWSRSGARIGGKDLRQVH